MVWKELNGRAGSVYPKSLESEKLVLKKVSKLEGASKWASLL